MKILLVILAAFLVQACASRHCRHLRDEENAQKASSAGGIKVPTSEELPMDKIKPSSADRVRVFRFDGSLQCGMGRGQSLSEMQKDLKNIPVHQSWKRHDGMMRIQLCGSPTGQSNVYEIDRKDLEAALKLGFKEWTVD